MNTTLEALDELLEMVESIAQYEMGNPEINQASYQSCLETCVKLAVRFDMPDYAAQCREKLTLPQNV
jgi:hypothetical protein